MRGLKLWALVVLIALVGAACAEEDGAEEPEAADPAEEEPAEEDPADDEPDEPADDAEEDAADGEASDLAGEDWPEPLTIYIPAPAGGGFDIAVRAMQPHIAEAIGNDVIPENIEGAGGAVAAEQMLGDPADGTTMMVVSRTIMSLPYTGTPDLDPLHDLEPIGVTHEDVAALSVAADSEFETAEDLVEHARENPGDLQIGTSGEGGVWHAAGVILEQAADVEFSYIPYDGGAPAGTATAGGEVDATTIGAPETAPFVENGELRMLAVMDDERVDIFPDVPTFEEAGYEGAEYSVWRGFVVAADTPQDVRDELSARIEEAVTSQESVEAMEDAGFVPTWQGPDEFRQHMEDEDELFPELFADTGVIVSEPERD